MVFNGKRSTDAGRQWTERPFEIRPTDTRNVRVGKDYARAWEKPDEPDSVTGQRTTRTEAFDKRASWRRRMKKKNHLAVGLEISTDPATVTSRDA